MSTEDQVRQASKQFYSALNSMTRGDVIPMSAVWSHSATVSTMHPIGGMEVGWEAVKGPWTQVAGIASDGQVHLEDQLIQVSGDMAYEIGTEKGGFKIAGNHVEVDQRVTNVYRREGDAWKIVHHHTDLSPAMLDVMASLQAA